MFENRELDPSNNVYRVDFTKRRLSEQPPTDYQLFRAEGQKVFTSAAVSIFYSKDHKNGMDGAIVLEAIATQRSDAEEITDVQDVAQFILSLDEEDRRHLRIATQYKGEQDIIDISREVIIDRYVDYKTKHTPDAPQPPPFAA